MRPFFAIVKLTLRNALRSHVFQLLLVLLLFCVTVIPFSIGGGSAQDFIRVSLLYSIWSVGVILSLASLWLGCFVMTQDVDSYQLHMVVAKPVSRWVVWLGKWVGITLINFVLLSAALTAVYMIVLHRYSQDGRFTAAEKEKITNEVLVGRRVFMPDTPDFQAIARGELKKNLSGSRNPVGQEEQEKLYEKLLEQAVVRNSELAAGQVKTWTFSNLPDSADVPVYIRFRPYIGKVSGSDQRVTRVWWQVLIPKIAESGKGKTLYYPQLLTPQPEQVFSGAFHENTIPPAWKAVSPEGKVMISVRNDDIYGDKQYYQPADGPKLLIRICGFAGNYIRAAGVLMMQLALLSALACALGGFLTMPTAIFMVISYLLFGSFATLLTDQSFYISTSFDRMGQFIAEAVLLVVIPLQAFDVTDLLASGELVEFSFIWELFFKYFILRGVPFVLFGIWCYSRRELGLVVRK